MKRRTFLGGCACCGMLAAHHALAQNIWQMPDRLARPDPATDEGGLWALLDREESRLKRSKFLIRDEALNRHINDMACRLAGNHCTDMRVYLVRTPFFNASMAPNGMMQIWSGLLLRMANEAQLAAVISHEIGHYVARHSIDQLRDAKSRSAFASFLGMALSAVGAGGIGAIAQLAIAAGMYAYTRDHEREADRIGLELMAKAGYEPLEAGRVWDQLLTELKAEDDWTGEPASRSVLFATHPREDERRDELNRQAASVQGVARQTGEQAWQNVMAPHRWGFLEDELKRRRFGETLALLDRMAASNPADGVVHFFRGEVYRQRGEHAPALEAYARAEQQRNAPPQLFRSRAQIMKAQGNESIAKANYQSYLARHPHAEDRELIASYLQ